ncbi:MULTISPECIES: hypothetical protein [Prauserella]|uniref:Phage shock protein B n=2 Tax=Prauserella TaxID=142577 RepID=A0A318L9Y9_9PSEU|nr:MULTISPECIES: hypothetical protein [Prauserella]PXY17561.1 hypothetical protein BA062_37385 [Prauserella flavalba]PXY18611.1 hypothetical protein BAY59_33580 [Prauserella coralliicola]TKG63543.1 hypothetical protein FCN18_30005 [Prauserella endophytica]
MPLWLTAIVLVVAMTFAYMFCIRPTLRGQGHCATPREDPELDRQIAELREEVRVLRAQDVLASGRVVGGRPGTPPVDD